ncbi:MAG: T9SS type A sorting domain-containing protein [Bacteroidales bacterium]|nr:T9SS type A sorting domain-containing protein [Bacteroidales bacterium]
MKRFYNQYFSLVVIFFLSITMTNGQTTETLNLGAGYSNDIFYSMQNGEVANVDRTNWDIAFYTHAFSDGIITNDGNGVVLYTYPNADTSGWDAIDTTGLAGWPKMMNSTESWELGAFNRNAKGHPDYGWGIYNMVTHNLTGDSLFIVKLSDGSFKKLWMVKKLSAMNMFKFRYANLDGSNVIEETVDCNPYTSKNFVYYSMMDQVVRDREPASDSWDILFTKYNEVLEGDTNYIVTGGLTNINAAANRFDMVSPDFADWMDMPIDSSRNAIGYDWKSFDFTTGWMVEDSTVFFVQDLEGNIHKLHFLTWEGSMTGIFSFEKSLVSPAGIDNLTSPFNILIYPNPASDYITLENKDPNENIHIQISDLSGKTVIEDYLTTEKITYDVSKLRSGIYLMTVRTAGSATTHKLLIK